MIRGRHPATNTKCWATCWTGRPTSAIPGMLVQRSIEAFKTWVIPTMFAKVAQR